MATLTVNNVEFPVAEGGLSSTTRDVGSTSPAFDGSLRKTRLAVRHDLAVHSVPLPLATAYAWEQLCNGVGDYWSFDASLYSSRGFGPTAYGAGVTLGAGGLAGGKLSVPGGQSVTFAGLWSAASGATLSYWRSPGTSGVWTHYLRRSTDAGAYVDGVLTDGALVSDLTGTGFTLVGDVSTPAFDEVVLLPYVVPAVWVAGLHGLRALGRTFSPLPRLDLAGTAVLEGGIRRVLGALGEAPYLQAGVPYMTLDVTFSEG